MHVLYVDMSGNLGDDRDRNFVMAGVSVKETAMYHVMRRLDELVAGNDFNIPSYTELHATHMLTGKKPWRHIERAKRETFYQQCLSTLGEQNHHNLRCFAIIIEKGSIDGTIEEEAYEQICSRFNSYLKKLYIKRGEEHRGLLIIDETRVWETFKNLASQYRADGTKWGSLRNLAEVPLFTASKDTRLLQLADLVSYAVWQKYERGDSRFFQQILQSFDYADGVYHGIYHRTNNWTTCDCPACVTRR